MLALLRSLLSRMFKCIYERDVVLCVVRVSDIHYGGLVLYIPLLKLPLPRLFGGVPSHLAHVRVTLSGGVGDKDHSGVLNCSTLGKPWLDVRVLVCSHTVASRFGCQEFVA